MVSADTGLSFGNSLDNKKSYISPKHPLFCKQSNAYLLCLFGTVAM